MSATAVLQWTDNARRFGIVTRFLHWSMAVLMAWQFAAILAYEVFGRTPLTDRWIHTHKDVGLVLALLLMVRAIWGLANRRRRPAPHGGLVGRAAAVGHLALYGLMLIIPILALMREFGSGEGFKPFGLVLAQAGGAKISWLMAPAELAHALLAWLLLAAVAGHIAMVIVHRFVWRDDTLSRMA
ncbi:cytochrome b [Brevundimonas sp.]|uniref:cytochrome b n=1 Tax=Brevundimonas sp. TaxID=1871086 RepID=UPI003BAA4167